MPNEARARKETAALLAHLRVGFGPKAGAEEQARLPELQKMREELRAKEATIADIEQEKAVAEGALQVALLEQQASVSRLRGQLEKVRADAATDAEGCLRETRITLEEERVRAGAAAE